ncbi:MAG: hypothetical protein CVT82_07895 [Alphaproteobacteria bacterium HGW-Alphaproteobacteria-4]|jgi:ElaB/YqjD/DUF883 family membrane-anchored ribosome-binding protein|nr:MAG: hypothetical protein CVT82_07895 [Alphaproteobacteria bacterium HGW-Alphaproteobacteria-4]
MDNKNPVTAIENSTEFKAMMADLAALRADVAQLAGHVKASTVSAAETAAGQVSAEATRLMGTVSDASKTSVKAVERQIDAHPLVSLMLAFSLGFVGSRLLAK